MEQFWNDFVNFFKNAGLNILFGIIILVVGLVLCKLIKVILRKILRRSKRDEAMSSFVVSLVDIILKIIVLITALATMGINTASIIAVVGTCGVAIGLALKDSLGNLASGIMIIFNKPFKKDDYVEIAGQEGQITQINLFNTTLVTYDNTVIVVPNSQAVNNPIVNYEGCKYRRIVVDVDLAKGTDIEGVKTILANIAENEPLLTKAVDYSVRMEEQTLNSVKIKLKAYAETANYWDAKYNLVEKTYEALKAEGLLSPNAQIDVHISGKPAEEKPVVRKEKGKGKPVALTKEFPVDKIDAMPDTDEPATISDVATDDSAPSDPKRRHTWETVAGKGDADD